MWTKCCQNQFYVLKVPIAANYKDVCLQNTSKSHSYHLKSVTKKEMNKCMAEIYDPGGIRTRAARLISQYHNHSAKENSP